MKQKDRDRMMKLIEHIKHFYYLVRPKTYIIQRSSKAIGDNLLLTSVLSEMKRLNPSHKIVIESNHPELFYNNPNCVAIFEKRWFRTKRHIRPKYSYDQSTNKHLIMQLLEYAGSDQFKCPEIFLTQEERKDTTISLPRDYITIAPNWETELCSKQKRLGI